MLRSTQISLNEEAVMMMQTMTRGTECSAAHLLVAFELGQE